MDKGTDKKADTQLSEKKSLTKDVKKGTDELSSRGKRYTQFTGRL